VCDDVADMRFGTPSLAAAAVVPDRAKLVERTAAAAERVEAALRWRLDQAGRRLAAVDLSAALMSGMRVAGARLQGLGERLESLHPRARVAVAGARLARVDWSGPLHARLAGARAGLGASRSVLDALDPDAVLARGYAVVRGPSGAVVRRPSEVSPGERLELVLAGGRMAATAGEAGR
ncbi:MAG: exodeoxyribonuclease VII large subunit, partial [Acidimicrobiales bacterium]